MFISMLIGLGDGEGTGAMSVAEITVTFSGIVVGDLGFSDSGRRLTNLVFKVLLVLGGIFKDFLG